MPRMMCNQQQGLGTNADIDWFCMQQIDKDAFLRTKQIPMVLQKKTQIPSNDVMLKGGNVIECHLFLPCSS